jgi:hypothetical protein
LHFVVFSKAIAACAQAIPTTIFENSAGLEFSGVDWWCGYFQVARSPVIFIPDETCGLRDNAPGGKPPGVFILSGIGRPADCE